VSRHAGEVSELNNIMAAIDAEEKERESEMRTEHEQTREEIRNRNLEEINVLRIMLDTGIEDLEQLFETAHWNYLHNTDDRTTKFKKLTRSDQELSKEIEQKIRKIDRLQSSLQLWRMKISQNVKECAQRNSQLMEEKNGIQAHFQHLKSRMNGFRSTQKRRLNELTKNANASKSLLKEKCELAERILKLAELGRKMETEAEKVTPFYVSSVEGEIEQQVSPPAADARGAPPHPTPLDSTSFPHPLARRRRRCRRRARRPPSRPTTATTTP
jgi:chromosome segregation ATPase